MSFSAMCRLSNQSTGLKTHFLLSNLWTRGKIPLRPSHQPVRTKALRLLRLNNLWTRGKIPLRPSHQPVRTKALRLLRLNNLWTRGSTPLRPVRTLKPPRLSNLSKGTTKFSSPPDGLVRNVASPTKPSAPLDLKVS